MAVTVVGTRLHEGFNSNSRRAFVSYALTGTYVTGGFVTPFSTGVITPKGASQFVSKTPLKFDWDSTLGYLYHTTITAGAGQAGPTCTTKIFSAPGTELANTTAVPEATVVCAIDMQKY